MAGYKKRISFVSASTQDLLNIVSYSTEMAALFLTRSIRSFVAVFV